MLTVQYSLYLTLEKHCVKKKKKKDETFVICYLNQNTVIIDGELSSTVTGHTRSSLLLCNISEHLFCSIL